MRPQISFGVAKVAPSHRICGAKVRPQIIFEVAKVVSGYKICGVEGHFKIVGAVKVITLRNIRLL